MPKWTLFVALNLDFKYYHYAGLLSVHSGGGINIVAKATDYELLPEMSESMIYTVMIRLMLKRLAKSYSVTS